MSYDHTVSMNYLKKADEKTWQEIFEPGYYGLPQELMTDRSITPCKPERWSDLIQGCIQRACERRGWEMEQNYRVRGRDAKLPKSLRHYSVITVWGGDVHTYRGSGSSAGAALLSAYLEALQHEA